MLALKLLEARIKPMTAILRQEIHVHRGRQDAGRETRDRHDRVSPYTYYERQRGVAE